MRRLLPKLAAGWFLIEILMAAQLGAAQLSHPPTDTRPAPSPSVQRPPAASPTSVPTRPRRPPPPRPPGHEVPSPNRDVSTPVSMVDCSQCRVAVETGRCPAAVAVAEADGCNKNGTLVTERDALLPEEIGWIVVVGFGGLFTWITRMASKWESQVTSTSMTSEHFNTGGRDVGVGLTASVIVSQWTWAATLLQSANVGWKHGISGPFWYASGATIQVLLFAVLAINVKRRAPSMHTYLEVILVRGWGWHSHVVFVFFALLCNAIVTAMLLLGGSAVIEQLTGLDRTWSCFLIPAGVLVYTYHGGLRATFFASYLHTCIIFAVLLTFAGAVYTGMSAPETGSTGTVLTALTKSAFNFRAGGGARHGFSFPEGLLENAGQCLPASWANATRAELGSRLNDKSSTEDASQLYCRFYRCSSANNLQCEEHNGGEWWMDKTVTDDSGATWFESGCEGSDNSEDPLVCVPSYLTLTSKGGLVFGIINIVGNFGTVFVDQAYWQSAVAAQPRATVRGFLLGGLVWFSIPFCMATAFGLAGRAISAIDDQFQPQDGRIEITTAEAQDGLVPAIVISDLLGQGGAFMLLTMLFMAVTSTGSAEVIAVSSVLTYDVFLTYIYPELRESVLLARDKWNDAVNMVGIDDERSVSREQLANLVKKLTCSGWLPTGGRALTKAFRYPSNLRSFSVDYGDEELSPRSLNIRSQPDPTEDELDCLITQLDLRRPSGKPGGPIPLTRVFRLLQRRSSRPAAEAGHLLVRVSRLFTVLFAFIMGFLAVLLQQLNLTLGYVYMSMGVVIGAAVVPIALAMLLETASGPACTAGAMLGVCFAVLAWFSTAYAQTGEVTIESTGLDGPLLVGNLVAIISGGLISGVGSIVRPDEQFSWSRLHDIPVVDDIPAPPSKYDLSAEELDAESKKATVQACVLTAILVVIWPTIMWFFGGVLGFAGFAIWVGTAVVWALVGAVVIILLPPIELQRAIYRRKKEVSDSSNACEQRQGGSTSRSDVDRSLPERLKVQIQVSRTDNVQDQITENVLASEPNRPPPSPPPMEEVDLPNDAPNTRLPDAEALDNETVF